MVPTWIIAIIYAGAFFYISSKRPTIALMLTFAAAPFQNDLSGDLPVRFSLAEVNLVLSLILVFVKSGANRLRFGPMLVPILLYFAISLISSLRGWRDSTTISLLQTALYLVVAVLVFSALGATIEAYRLPYYGLIAVGVFIGGLSFLDPSNFLALGLNKNGIGGSLACCVLVGTELWLNSTNPKHKKMLLVSLVLIAGGLVSTLSRGSWLGTITGLMVLFSIKAQFKAMFRTFAVLVPVAAICWSQLPAEAQDFASGFDTKRQNISARLDSINIADSYFESEPVLGCGVGLRKEFDATNIVMTVLAETGVLGLAAFVGIHVVFFMMVTTVRLRVAPSSSACSILAIGGALLTAQLTHGMVDHYWSRGSLMLAWAGVGMVTRCYFDLGEIVPLRKAAKAGGFSALPPTGAPAASMTAPQAPLRMPSGRPKPGQWNRPIRHPNTEID